MKIYGTCELSKASETMTDQTDSIRIKPGFHDMFFESLGFLNHGNNITLVLFISKSIPESCQHILI